MVCLQRGFVQTLICQKSNVALNVHLQKDDFAERMTSMITWRSPHFFSHRPMMLTLWLFLIGYSVAW